MHILRVHRAFLYLFFINVQVYQVGYHDKDVIYEGKIRYYKNSNLITYVGDVGGKYSCQVAPLLSNLYYLH